MEKIKAKKSLGQNFLIDQEALADIADAIAISGKNIIEVGPGYGALTDYIIERKPLSLELVELDSDMIHILEWRYDQSKLTIHHTDVLQFIPKHKDYSVIANIPYYITSPILFHFLYDIQDQPDDMVIMMQKEVGEKILEGRKEKKPHHSFLSLCMEYACEDIKIIRYVDRSSFDPEPKVDSIVLGFSRKKNRDLQQEKQLIYLWKVAFAHPRKTLLSNLKWSTYNSESIRNIIIELWYDERVRAEAINKNDWIFLLQN